MQCTCRVAGYSLLLIAVAGCGTEGPELVDAGGTVLYNGNPVPNANVMFVLEEGGGAAPVASGTTNEQGVFTLRSGSGAGAVPGRHRVSVRAVEGGPAEVEGEIPEDPLEYQEQYAEAMGDADAPEEKWLIPQTYGSIETSGLSYEITQGGDNTFQIELSDQE